MSKIKNGGLDQYGAGPFEQQQFGTAGVEGVNSDSVCKFHRLLGQLFDTPSTGRNLSFAISRHVEPLRDHVSWFVCSTLAMLCRYRGGVRVSDRTRIVLAPPSVVVASSTDDVTLRCQATTDARRTSHLLVTWYRDQLPVSQTDRLTIADGGWRLAIENAMVSDTGVYRCTASNGVDEDSSTVVLTIKGLAQFS